MKLRSDNYKKRPSIKELRDILKKLGITVTVTRGCPLTIGYSVTGIKKVSKHRLEREVIRDELKEAMKSGLLQGNKDDFMTAADELFGDDV